MLEAKKFIYYINHIKHAGAFHFMEVAEGMGQQFRAGHVVDQPLQNTIATLLFFASILSRSHLLKERICS